MDLERVHFFSLRQYFLGKRENVIKKFQNIIIFEKKRKKNFSEKPEYPENRGIFRDFFSWFFSKIKFSTSPYKKKSKK
jgi:hypothetical protein